MKKMFRLFSAASMVVGFCFSFTACDPETEVKTGVVTFEDVPLDSTGYWNGSDKTGTFSSYDAWGSTINSYADHFKSGILTCPTVFNEDQFFFSTWWSGIACSNHTDTQTIGLANQYSVYASSGAAGSKNFALIGSHGAQCSFDESVTLKSLMINNSTYVFWALKEGHDGFGAVKKFEADDYFYVAVAGYDSTGAQTGKVEIPLAEFRNSQTYICSSWTKVSLKSLGKVKSLVFTFTSSDTGDYGMNTPAYVCIDNIEYEIN